MGWTPGNILASEQLRGRVAIVVGNNLGQPGQVQLRFAQDDARRVAQVMKELGGVTGDHLFLLLDRDADAVRDAFSQAARLAASVRTDLVFFYSGHADSDSLNLGGSRLSWKELQTLMEQSQANLKIGIVDACQAGMLSRPKGFSLTQGLDHTEHQGTAFLLAAEPSEIAQESVNLSGSVFTHYLVSGLRGAADANQDRRVTLSEARDYATLHTRRVTASWAKAVQHPVYVFDLMGHGDIVLTDLRKSTAGFRVDEQVHGYLVVVEKESSRVVAECQKDAGRELEIALPTGRYLVHLRKEKSVLLAELSLPWGGIKTLDPGSWVSRSYQEVARKGMHMELHRHRLRLEARLGNGPVSGMGFLGMLQVGYGLKLAPWTLGLRLGWGQDEFDTVDTRVDVQMLSVGLVGGIEWPVSLLDFKLYLVVEGQQWWQTVQKEGERRSLLVGTGLGAGFRVPLFGRLFAELSLEGMIYYPQLEDKGRETRFTGSGVVGIGMLF